VGYGRALDSPFPVMNRVPLGEPIFQQHSDTHSNPPRRLAYFLPISCIGCPVWPVLTAPLRLVACRRCPFARASDILGAAAGLAVRDRRRRESQHL
jgi:hypothetical protein